jgi:predicted metalloprotease
MSTSSRPVGAAVGGLTLALVLSGCAASIVPGQASSAEPAVVDVSQAEFEIYGAGDGPADVTARNAFADLNTFWAQVYPEVYGADFPQLTGGYFSVDPGDFDPSQYPNGDELPCGAGPADVEQNAFYCPPEAPEGDAIAYDRVFMQELYDTYGRFLPALVMAHEFGHAIQGREGYPADDTSINTETQADCFAGAWTRWVSEGNAAHETIRAPDLDDLLRGYIVVRDPVGTGVEEDGAHGSYFDRVSAIQQGFDGGVASCRDGFEDDRRFTQGEFQTDEEAQSGGNASPEEVTSLIESALPEYYEDSFPEDLGADFSAPTIEAFEGTAPECEGVSPDANVYYCAADDTVGYDTVDLADPAYSDIGDYAVLTAVAIPYGLAAREQRGLSTDDQDAIRSAACQAGAFSGAVLNAEVPSITISPGDFDEAVQFLLTYGTDRTVFPDVGLSGFQLVDVFRTGYLQGLTSCGL